MLFKFPKLSLRKTRQQQQQQQQQQQPPIDDSCKPTKLARRLSRSLSRFRCRARQQADDNISECSSIELARQQACSRPSSSALLGQLLFSQAQHDKTDRPQSIVSMCDDDHQVPTAALPALASVSNLEPYDDALLAARRANYARRNIGAMQPKNPEGEWTFKLYDMPGPEGDKADFSEVAKSIRKTLVSSLTPLLVETTAQLRQMGSCGSSGDGSNSAPGAVHLHITMKPEFQQSSSIEKRNSTTPDCRVTPDTSNNNDHVCVVRVSAKISNDDRSSTSPPVEPQAATKSEKPYGSLQRVDDIMMQSMPAELLDSRHLMKRDRRLRRHRNQSNLYNAESAARLSKLSSSNPDLTVSDYDGISPVYYQQEILKRAEARHRSVPKQPSAKACGQTPFDVRCARVVSLNQPHRHFYHYDRDDLFSETSVVGTFEERASSIAKCLVWMSNITDEEVVASPGKSPRRRASSQLRKQPKHLEPVKEQASPVIGAGEALAEPPSYQKVYHHIHHHRHFVAQF